MLPRTLHTPCSCGDNCGIMMEVVLLEMLVLVVVVLEMMVMVVLLEMMMTTGHT